VFGQNWKNQVTKFMKRCTKKNLNIIKDQHHMLNSTNAMQSPEMVWNDKQAIVSNDDSVWRPQSTVPTNDILIHTRQQDNSIQKWTIQCHVRAYSYKIWKFSTNMLNRLEYKIQIGISISKPIVDPAGWSFGPNSTFWILREPPVLGTTPNLMVRKSPKGGFLCWGDPKSRTRRKTNPPSKS
jgi:hypothetical protein